MSDALQSLKDTFRDLHDALPPWGRYAIIGAGGVAAYLYIRSGRKVDRPLKKDFVKDRVYVYQFPRCRYLPSISPFALKLETWLRMAKIPYENVVLADQNMSTRSSEGTMPFIEYNGNEHPDSGFCIRDMTRIFKKEDMMSHLSDAEKGELRAIDAMTENSLLTAYAYFRYTQHIEKVFGAFPLEKYVSPVKVFIWQLFMPFMKTGIMKRMKMNPICKHSDVEIENIAMDDIRALSDILGDKPYFLGSKPTQTDALVFSVIAQILYLPIDLPHKKYLQEKATNLIAHTERVKKEFWPDWDKVTTEFNLN